jgi:AcrR family transcriptional regulator
MAPKSSSRDRGEEPESSSPKILLPLALSKLSPGDHELPRELILENQRARLLEAGLTVFSDRGFVKASVSGLIEEAGTSRATFYAIFPDKAGCFLAVYEASLARLEAAARAGIEAADTWPLQLRAATENVLAQLAADPRLARICTVEVRAAGPDVDARHSRLVERIAEGLRGGRRHHPEGERLPLLLERALIGGSSALIASASLGDETSAFAQLGPELTELLLAAYLGPVEARRIARA